MQEVSNFASPEELLPAFKVCRGADWVSDAVYELVTRTTWRFGMWCS